MKKIIFILLLLFLLTGCTNNNNNPHTHEFVNGKCECGEIDPNYEVPHTHEFVNGKCECGEIDPNYEPPHTHEFVNGKCECGEIDPNYEVTYYEVVFKDKYGNIIDTVLTKEGEKASEPVAPTLKYFTFFGWSEDITCVNSNMEVSAVYTKDKTEYLNNDANYWLRLLADKYEINKTILTLEEIKAYNEAIVSDYSKTKVVDVLSLDKNVSKEYIKGLIESYNNINKYTVYSNDTKNALTTAEKNIILNNRALDNITDKEVVWGIITDFAWMRTYPTNDYSSTYDRDRFQETSLNVGEVVRIYHTSLDESWYFVQATNYYGWVEAKYIGVCSFETAENFVKADDFIVVISDYLVIEGAHVRMGQTFPILKEDSNYIVNFPTRDSNGRLVLKEVEIAKDENVSKGYLEYNYENLYIQAFKLLNIKYSWGDKEKLGRDCSSTQNAIYATFGFKMPRNTSNQNKIPGFGKSVSNMTVGELKDNYAPGTLIFSSGHVMMYIGENVSGQSYIFHNTSAGSGKCILQNVSQYGINKIIGILEMQ